MIPALENHLWQSTLFACLMALLTLGLRGNRAAVRHWIWLAASAKFLLPFSLLVTLGSQIDWHQAPAAVPAHVSSVMNQISQPFAPPSPPSWPVSGPDRRHRIPAMLLGVWLCGFAANSLAWWRRWRSVRAAMRAASPLPLSFPVPVMSGPARLEPGVFGIIRPRLLLPEGIDERLDPAQFEAVLAHELCHVRRRDNLLASIHMIVEATFWFHPLVWWIGARLIEERERACDEEVLSQLGEPQVYAEGILSVCKLYVESPLVCVSGVTGGGLKRRIEEIMHNRTLPRLSRAKKIALASAAAAALAVPLVVGVGNAPAMRAQSPTGGPLPQFDVASVKPSMPGEFAFENFPLGSGNVFVPNGGYLVARGVPLSRYIFFAYRIMNNQRLALLPKLPAWVNTERYDIEARAEGNPDKDQMRLMMRSLLADRFKLAIHTERREVPAIAFVLLKPGLTGPQLHAHTEDAPCPTDGPPQSAVASGQAPPPNQPDSSGFPNVCGGIFGMRPSAEGLRKLGARNVSIEFIAESVSGPANLGRPMVDRTGLPGKFDFTLEWAPELGGLQAPGAEAAADTPELTFEQALRDQLGIKMESAKGYEDVFVVDYIEHPSPN